MTIGIADLAKSINTVWDSSTLDTSFNSLWDAADVAIFPVLNDGEATPKQPFPYCVYEIDTGYITSRMSGDAVENRVIDDVPVAFTVHARVLDGDSRTAKEIAAAMIEEILKIFGGHPTVSPTVLTLDSSNFLQTKYVSELPVRTGDDEYSWVINYIITIDNPIAL